MREIQEPLRAAYITALTGITINGITLPVYDEFAADNAPDHYIIITNQTDSGIPVKNQFTSGASITVDITTKFKAGEGGKAFSELIANEVLKIVKPLNAHLDLSPDFQIYKTHKKLTHNMSENLPTGWVFRKILVFEHEINQLVND